MKVLHLPTSVGGNSFGLSRGEKKLGLESSILVSEDSWLNYAADINLNLQHTQSFPKRLFKLAKAFVEIRSRFDVFHFNYGRSLINFPNWGFLHCELPYYPAGTKLFVTYNGCDARQKYPTMSRTPVAACHQKDCYGGMCNSGKRDELRRKGIAKMSRNVQHIWALNPDLLRFLPQEKSSFLPYTIHRWEDLPHCPVDFNKTRLRIAHAPTDRGAKGTEFILNALNDLAEKYSDQVDIKLIEKVTHAQCLKLLEDVDVVVDQILIGWYGALGVEAMKMGKPVIARIAQEDLNFLPEPMANEVQDAVIPAEPKNIYAVLERCLGDRKFLRQKAEAGREYVNRWHDPLYVAGLTQKEYSS